jgi:hypothetical protein
MSETITGDDGRVIGVIVMTPDGKYEASRRERVCGGIPGNVHMIHKAFGTREEARVWIERGAVESPEGDIV